MIFIFVKVETKVHKINLKNNACGWINENRNTFNFHSQDRNFLSKLNYRKL
jgi:hypothetical protein